MITKITSFRIAILKQIALMLVIVSAGFLFSTIIVAQGTTPPQPVNSAQKPHRWTPEDDPSFKHDRYSFNMGFSSWVASQSKYPQKALKEKIQGWVHVGYIVELDGTISNVKINATPDPELGEAVAKAVKSSPKWMPAKNKENASLFKSSVNIKFEIPERVLSSQDIPVYVIGEVPAYLSEELHRSLEEGQMPQIPQAKDTTLEATNAALKEWVDQHLKYPDKASKEKVEGTVTIRFIITKSGKLEDFTVIKSIHPLLDAETLRVLSLMPDWKPAKQGGEPKDVYYYEEVEFKLPK
jgi:TonB family protein